MKILFKYYGMTSLFILANFFMPASVRAQVPLDTELKPDFLPNIDRGVTAEDKIFGLAGNIIITAFQVAGGVAIIFLILAAFQYILAGGEEEKMKTAQKSIFWIIGGLILLMTSYIIVQFVLKVTLVTEEAN